MGKLLIYCSAIVVLLVLGSALAQGDQIFSQNCAVCHGSEGGGSSGPPLANNPDLADTTAVLRQIHNGGQAMPPFRSRLDDEQIAAVATHIRTSWGNSFGPVTAEQSAAVRAGGEAGPDAEQGGGQAGGQSQAEQQEQPPVTIATADVGGESKLVDQDGRTLYRYVYEAPEGTPYCYLNCLNRWSPVLTGEPQAGEGIESGDLGTVERDDGGMQVTFRGWPLYRFVGDGESGDVTGDEISDIWTSVTPDVEPVEDSLGLAAGEQSAQ